MKTKSTPSRGPAANNLILTLGVLIASTQFTAFCVAAGAPAPAQSFLVRGVRVTTKQDALFSKGMVAKDTIDLNGNNIKSDSFDSNDPSHSNNGRYDPNKIKANGDVASNSSLTNSLNIGNADIYGRVSTGPNGSVSIGANGSVGDLDWHAANKKGVEPGYSRDDMNVEFPEVPVPFTSGAVAPKSGYVTNADSTVTYYDYILDNGAYQSANLSGKVLVRGNAALLVTTSVNLTGKDSITIKNGKSLKLFVSASSASLGGNGVINEGGNATNFAYYGMPGNTSLSISGNGAISGTIYAPNAALTLNGGGNDDTDFIGASISKSVKMNGHFKFHYDEALRFWGPPRGFVVTSWNEMDPSQVGATIVTGVPR